MLNTRTATLLAGLAMLITSACQPAPSGPVKAEVRQVDDGYQLFVNDEPFYIKGAGLEFGDIESLAAHGANSFRTWRTENGESSPEEILDRAHAAGLMVTMGIEIGREREGTGAGAFGFDYDDEEAVAQQLEEVREQVMRLKDHPALLMWGIGNELNLFYTNPACWDAVNDISKMIHEIDPNHPTTTMLAGINPELAHEVLTRAPDLDAVSIQMYADITNLPRYLEEMGWPKPYIVSEWGATGHWEVGLTPWDAPIENHSSIKADLYGERFETAIAKQPLSLGSYVFLWGQKQERTPTWYGMFMPTGEETEAVDVMHRAWNGEWPANRSPRLEAVSLNGQRANDGVMLNPGEAYPISVTSSDPDGDNLTYHWEIMEESTSLGDGGDLEDVPDVMEDLIAEPDAAASTMTAPALPGAYRLFVYVYDGQNHAAHANIRFT